MGRERSSTWLRFRRRRCQVVRGYVRELHTGVQPSLRGVVRSSKRFNI
ncbi:hypothetical protein BN903_4 [Halorubrum sp. AJ67]|nr:hypothetical protein BN903_4 [Halorubrum sp. AJ67]